VTDWDAPFDGVEPTPGVTTRVSVFATCALVRLLCLPFDLLAGLTHRTRSDDGTDAAGADEGAWNIPHNDGCNAA
jgi:hypothetical protein